MFDSTLHPEGSTQPLQEENKHIGSVGESEHRRYLGFFLVGSIASHRISCKVHSQQPQCRTGIAYDVRGTRRPQNGGNCRYLHRIGDATVLVSPCIECIEILSNSGVVSDHYTELDLRNRSLQSTIPMRHVSNGAIVADRLLDFAVLTGPDVVNYGRTV